VARRPPPGLGEVHIWRASLDLPAEVLAKLEQSLSTDERDRAKRFRIESGRDRFTAARGWLRGLLAGYLDAEPSELAFRQDPSGKPRLTWPHAPWLRFNLSHSAGLVVFAVVRGREVGVDVEQIRRDFPVEAVARRIFSRPERQALDVLPLGHRVDAFFALWTRKEAYLKGLGVGWGESEVGRRAARRLLGPADLFGREHSPDGYEQCSLAAFEAGPGYAAALAVEGGEIRIPPAAQPISLTLA
jgi:4'-phosphopantetheinyl transferase